MFQTVSTQQINKLQSFRVYLEKSGLLSSRPFDKYFIGWNFVNVGKTLDGCKISYLLSNVRYITSFQIPVIEGIYIQQKNKQKFRYLAGTLMEHFFEGNCLLRLWCVYYSEVKVCELLSSQLSFFEVYFFPNRLYVIVLVVNTMGHKYYKVQQKQLNAFRGF